MQIESKMWNKIDILKTLPKKTANWGKEESWQPSLCTKHLFPSYSQMDFKDHQDKKDTFNIELLEKQYHKP